MEKIKIEINPYKKEITIEIPKEIKKKLSKNDVDEINLKIFGISAMLSNIVNN